MQPHLSAQVARHDAATGQHAHPGDSEEKVNATAVAAYRASIDSGKPISERRLAGMFGKTSRRRARHRMAEARRVRATARGHGVPTRRTAGAGARSAVQAP